MLPVSNYANYAPNNQRVGVSTRNIIVPLVSALSVTLAGCNEQKIAPELQKVAPAFSRTCQNSLGEAIKLGSSSQKGLDELILQNCSEPNVQKTWCPIVVKPGTNITNCDTSLPPPSKGKPLAPAPAKTASP